MLLDCGRQPSRQDRGSVLVAFWTSHRDLASAEIHIFEAQRDALVDTQSCAIHQLGHEQGGSAHVSEHIAHLARAEHDRQAIAALHATKASQLSEWLFENLAIEKDDRVEGLSLRWSRNVTINGQMVQKALDVMFIELTRMLLAMKENELASPVPIRLNRSGTEVSAMAYEAELLEEFGWLVSRCCTQTW
jgi:hypothetical protein